MNSLLPVLSAKIQTFEQRFAQITVDRKVTLNTIAKQLLAYIESRGEQKSRFIFICTHNSRRSHISQLWAQVIAYYFGFENIETYSGGTEATAFFPSAVQAMENMGFQIDKTVDQTNPIYALTFSEELPALEAYSKVYDAPDNPQEDFVAMMTCSHADENCPLILGADLRIPLLYEDPKVYDGQAIAQQKYNEKAEEIGGELTYVFSTIKQLIG